MCNKEREQQILDEIAKIITESDKDYFNKLSLLEQIIQKELEPFYRVILGEYIKKEWENCEVMRCNIDSEESYLYHKNFATTPVPWNIFKTFVDSSDCWCGNCESSEEIEESDRIKMKMVAFW